MNLKRATLAILMLVNLLVACKTHNITRADITFEASKYSIYTGETTQLKWNVPVPLGTAEIEITGVSNQLDNSGIFDVSPLKSKTYVLKVKYKKHLFSKTLRVKVAPNPLPKASIASFTASPTELNFGESAEISWRIKNFTNETIEIKGADIHLSDSAGTFQITPYEDTRLIMRILKKTAVVDRKILDIKVKKNLSQIIFSKGPDDGRFTIGGNNKRLMYGWPVPRSTSHFIVKVNDNYGCNRPGFLGNNKYYLSGTQKITGTQQSLQLEIEYFLDGVKIIQRLIPVDKAFKQVNLNEYGQYYKIEYELHNTADEPKTVGLISLIDIMLDDNDAPKVMAKGKLFDRESSFVKPDIADNYTAYYKIGDKNQLRSRLVLNNGASKPDTLFVGKWPILHAVVWDVVQGNDKYGDSGFLLKWNARTLAKDQKKVYSFYYGLPYDGEVSMLPVVKDLESNNIDVFFAKGSSTLDNTAKLRIDSLLNTVQGVVSGVLVNGYSDAVGMDDINLRYSEKRVKAVIAYLKSKGISSSICIPKYYGESQALQSEDARENGNPPDRKSSITIFSTKKTE